MKKGLLFILVTLSLWSFGLLGQAIAQTTPASPSGTVLKSAEIAHQLDAAKAAHRQEIDDAKKALLHTIDQRINAATDAGDLNLVTSLQAVQATAAVDATVPDDVKDAAVLAAKRNYETAIKSANTHLNLAYQKAVRDYTRAREIAQAQSTQAEMNSLGLVDPTAPSAMTAGTYQLTARLPDFLTAKNSIFVPLGDRLGIVVPETQFVRTREGDLLSKNFTADFWFYMVKGMRGYPKLPAALIGLGEGTANPVNGGPLDSLYLEINPPDQNGGEINLHRRVASEKATIGHLKEFDTYVARIQKSGDSVTFAIGTEQSGTLVPTISVTVDDVRSDSPYLNETNTHLFFGSGAFEKLSIGKGPPPIKAEAAKPLLNAEDSKTAATGTDKLIHLRIHAVIDDSDELSITKNSASWRHGGGDWPSFVKLNSVSMDSRKPLQNEDPTAFLDPNADLDSVTVLQQTGRGSINVKSEHGKVVIKFADPESGSDSYYVDLVFQPLPAVTPVTAVAPAPVAPAEKPTATSDGKSFSPRTINLLALCDPKRDAVKGNWRKEDGELFVQSGNGPQLDFAYKPPAEYDYYVDFTRGDCKYGTTFIMPHADRMVFWDMNGRVGDGSAFAQMDEALRPKATCSLRMENNHRYKCRIEVRADRLRAFVNEKMVLEYLTNYSEFQDPPNFVQQTTHLGLLDWWSNVHYHKVEVIERSGPGTYFPPDGDETHDIPVKAIVTAP